MMNLSTRLLWHRHRLLAVAMTSLRVMMLPSQRLCGVGVLDLATISTFMMQVTLQILSGIRLVIVNSVQVQECKPASYTYTLPQGSIQIQAMRANLMYGSSTASAASCTSGGYDDTDDLVLVITVKPNQPAPPTNPPTANPTPNPTPQPSNPASIAHSFQSSNYGTPPPYNTDKVSHFSVYSAANRCSHKESYSSQPPHQHRPII